VASFDSVLGSCFRNRLPLHVAGLIDTAAFQRNNVIDDVTWTRSRSPAGRRAGITSLESFARRRVPHDPTVCVALARRTAGRSGPGVAPGYTGSTRVAGRTIADFGACFASAGAGFAAGNAAARTAAPAGGGADYAGGEDQGDEESAHTRRLSAG